ncbi:MAG TPA: DNA repair exonuclease [Methanomassiliicoccales archaeon]|nr:DNA repair exonuclease [Methanomassiliicoccales archaeon]
MRIAHVSDTHLGFSAYGRLDEESGLNQREVDFYQAFERAVDAILEAKVDVVLHSGDVFDSVRPSNRALSFALDQFARISEAGVPTVVIAGNHSTPKLRETGSVFKVFEHLKDVHPVYKGEYEQIELGDLAVHAVPHCEGEALQNAMAEMKPRPGKVNVGMLHVGVASIQDFRMGEFNEQVVPVSTLNESLDYIALGHYHGHVNVTRNATYSGSMERLSFAEAGDEKGFVIVDLEKRKKQFVPIPTRAMIDLAPIDARRMSAEELKAAMRDLIEGTELGGKIVRLRVDDVPSAVYRAIDHVWLRSATADAMHFDARFEVAQEASAGQRATTHIDSLEKEFVSFLEHYPVERMDKGKLRASGLRYLQRGLESSD